MAFAFSSPPTYSDFASRFPELVASPNAPDASTQTWIANRAESAWNGMDTGVWRVVADRQEGALLRAAHDLVMRRRAAASLSISAEIPAGPLTSRSEGEWSKSYQSIGVSGVTGVDGVWLQTPYGQAWLQLRNEVVGVYGGRISL